jgi:hypothetical protein
MSSRPNQSPNLIPSLNRLIDCTATDETFGGVGVRALSCKLITRALRFGECVSRPLALLKAKLRSHTVQLHDTSLARSIMSSTVGGSLSIKLCGVPELHRFLTFK